MQNINEKKFCLANLMLFDESFAHLKLDTPNIGPNHTRGLPLPKVLSFDRPCEKETRIQKWTVLNSFSSQLFGKCLAQPIRLRHY